MFELSIHFHHTFHLFSTEMFKNSVIKPTLQGFQNGSELLVSANIEKKIYKLVLRNVSRNWDTAINVYYFSVKFQKLYACTQVQFHPNNEANVFHTKL